MTENTMPFDPRRGAGSPGRPSSGQFGSPRLSKSLGCCKFWLEPMGIWEISVSIAAGSCIKTTSSKFRLRSLFIYSQTTRNGAVIISQLEQGVVMRIVTLLAATAFGLAGIQAASAADMGLPLKAPPPPPPAWTWTGFYIGGNAGAGYGQVDQQLNFPGPGFGPMAFDSQPISGFLGGAQLGYNWQMPNAPVVLGIEGEWDWAGLSGTAPCNLNFFGAIVGMNCNVQENWIADVAGRIGFTADRALIYVKGGVAWAGNQYNGTIFPLVGQIPVTASETKVGGLLGVGVEYAVIGNWSAKLEYDFIDFGSTNNAMTIGGVAVPSTIVNLGVRETVSEVKFGINYRWNWAP